VRTTLTPGWFARRIYRLIAARSAHAICIVEPVKQHFLSLAGKTADPKKISVVNNIASRLDVSLPRYKAFDRLPGRFRVLSLANFSPNRGVDRIIDVADVLHRSGDRHFAFYLFGRPANTHAITGRTDPYYNSLRARVQELRLENMVFFPGHLSAPEEALIGCDALIKLTRQSNPWGRDIMEALAAGLPVITLGAFQGFVEDKVNGYVAEVFNPEEIAGYLRKLAANSQLHHTIAAANKLKAERLFGASACAVAVEAIYRRALGGAPSA
jgi:glycosyltransferase involved in cell wall biosynthesis